MIEVEFDEWRQDLVVNDKLIQKNVLFIRARKSNIEFHVPIFDESDIMIENAKYLLTLEVENAYNQTRGS